MTLFEIHFYIFEMFYFKYRNLSKHLETQTDLKCILMKTFIYSPRVMSEMTE